MSQSLAVLRECADRIEAETIRIRLAAEGITAFISGANAAVALSMGGAGSLRFVRVEVAQDDLLTAMELLAEDEQRTKASAAWICRRCHENNEASFDICWSCSKPRDSQDAQVPTPSPKGDGISVETADPIAEDLNPYRPVMLSPEQSRVASDESQQERVRRAFRASIVGIILLPPLLNIYSIFCLINLTLADDVRDSELRRRMRITWVVNLVVIVASLIFWLRLV